MEGNTTPWLIADILLLGLLGLLAWHRFKGRRLRAKLEEMAENSDARMRELATEKEEQQRLIHSDYTTRLSEMQQAHGAGMQAVQARHGQEVDDLQAQMALVTERKDRLERKVNEQVEFDLVSRRHLLHRLQSLQLNGALLTNVRFTSGSRRGQGFHHQIDHLILTDTAAIVVENKHWSGLIFDSVHPEDLHPSWQHVTRGMELGDEFVLHVQQPSDMQGDEYTVGVRVKATSRRSTPPRRQAVNQAAALQELLSQQPGLRAPDFIQPAVFYSHPDAVVYAQRGPLGNSRLDVPILTVRDTVLIDRVLHAADPRGRRFDVRAVAEALAPQTTDITGFGTHSEVWTPVLL